MKKKLNKGSSWSFDDFPQILRIMKLVGVFMFVALVQVSASSYSQTKELTIKGNHLTLEELFEIIENQSEFSFMYNLKQIDLSKEVDVDVENKTVDKVLDQVLNGTDITYTVSNRLIVIHKKNNMTLTEKLAERQQQSVVGKVTDSSGSPLPGVTVVVEGTTQGTITDNDGYYSLDDVPSGGVLVFSFVGMRTQKIPVSGKTSINITLVEEAIGIEEVVAIGYGSQKKVNLTGAISMAGSERLENRPITSAGQGLQGVIPNLNITIRNGDPTQSVDYNIRGYESINGGSPLVLVDGVPMDLERINPDDIANVVVLKDAAAAAVYGARAAFGVVLVETKKGKKGEKINLTFNTEQSLAKPIFLMDVVTDPYVFVNAYNNAYLRTKGQVKYDEYYVEGTKRWVENPNEENAWEVVGGQLRYYGFNNYQNQVVTDFAPQQEYNMTIDGATEKASYYVSFGYLNKDGYLKSNNEKYKRYNILMKADFSINDWLALEEKIVFNSQNSDKPHFYNWDVNINSVARVSPIQPVQFPNLDYYINDGDHDIYSQYIGMYFEGTNFLPYLKNGGRTTFTSNDIWFTQGVTLSPIKGLKIKGDFSYNSYHRDYQDVASKVDVVKTNLLETNMIDNGYSGTDYISNVSNYNQYYVFNTYAEYTFNKIQHHYIKGMIGYNQEWGRYTSIGAKAYSLLTQNINDLNATRGTQETSGSKDHVALRGVFYRLNYIYKDKYLIETNGRYDGTSRFSKDSRFGFFPSISLGWRISNEPFFEKSRKWLDNLKLRASYGELGNQLLGNNYYPYIATMQSGMASYVMDNGKIPYVSSSGLVSPDLTWETVISKNVGLDLTTFKQKLDISLDFYIRDTKDMLMEIEYPDVLGTDAPKQNAADLRTKGWELSVSWNDAIGNDLKYGMTFSLSDNQSEITKYDNPTGALSEYYVGKKIGEIWGYVTDGIFQSDEEVENSPDQSRLGSNWQAGDIKYKDLNNDEIISAGNATLTDPGDKKIIGNTTARYSFGINPSLSYKNWSLNIFFQGLFRDYLPSNNDYNAFYPFNAEYIDKYFLTETWSVDNPNAYFAAPHISIDNKKNIQPQSRYIQNAAYIRLKNLTLNYNLPDKLIRRIGMDRAQIYFSGMNLWEYTKMHKPLDPENVSTVTQEYYFQRIYTLGVKVTL